MASRVPCFGVEALKVPGLPIPQSLCCLKFQLRRAHYPVRTVRRTVRAQCRAHFRAPHWQCTVPTGGKGRPSGLPRLARSAQIHSKCLPHSPPTRQAPFSTILNHSQPFSTTLTISHLNCKCAPTHCHLIKLLRLLKLTKHLRHPVAPTLKITCQPYMACQR